MTRTKLAVYAIAHTVRKLAQGALDPEKVFTLLDHLGVEKIYLENYRDGLFVSPSELGKVRKLFEGKYEVAGGTCIGTWGEGWGRYVPEDHESFRVVCLTDERNLELLAKAARELGSVFEEALIDDFWAQWCTCPYCVERFNSEFGLRVTPEALRRELARGDTPTARMWARFSTELLSRVSREFVVKPFREAGGKRIVDKVAEWREDFYVRGLFLPEVAKVFDGVYVGTESRERVNSYGSHYITLLVKELAGRVEGVWFDTYDGLGWARSVSVETYVEQLLASLTPLPPELTLFNLEDLLHPTREPHVFALEKHAKPLREALAEVKGEPLGLLRPALQPPFSPVEDRYVEDYIGSIGIPLKPARSIPAGSCVLLTAKEVGLLDFSELAEKAKLILLTSGAVRRILRGDAGDAGYELLGADASDLVYNHFAASEFEYKGARAREGHRRACELPVGPVLKVPGAEVVVAASDGWERWPAIFKVERKGVKIVAACTTDYPYLLGQYPEIVNQALRDIAGEFLGVTAASSTWATLYNFTLHVYSDGHLVVANHNPHWLSARLRIDREKTGFSGRPKLLAGSADLRETETGLAVGLPPRSYAVIEIG